MPSGGLLFRKLSLNDAPLVIRVGLAVAETSAGLRSWAAVEPRASASVRMGASEGNGSDFSCDMLAGVVEMNQDVNT